MQKIDKLGLLKELNIHASSRGITVSEVLEKYVVLLTKAELHFVVCELNLSHYLLDLNTTTLKARKLDREYLDF